MRVIARRGRVTDDSFFLLCCLFGAGDVMVAEMVRHEGHVADRCQDAVLILRVAFIAGLRRRDEITDQQTRTARATSSVNKPLSENVGEALRYQAMLGIARHCLCVGARKWFRRMTVLAHALPRTVRWLNAG
jgi:hypothetical protein